MRSNIFNFHSSVPSSTVFNFDHHLIYPIYYPITMPARTYFTTVWTITRVEFEDIRQRKISKIISPSYNNVVFRLRLEFRRSLDPPKFRMSIFYEDGPLCSLDDCTIGYSPQNATKWYITDCGRQYQYQLKRGEGNHWPNFEDNDLDVLNRKYGLDASDDFHFGITIAIPLTAFDYEIPEPEIEQRRVWLTGIFKSLKDVEKADFSDVRFVARDGDPFYCHRIIIGRQSKVLEIMMKNPKSDEEMSGVFCFPSLDTDSLNAILNYLYTGAYGSLAELSAPLIIQVADFSEQYELQLLKEACIRELWKVVVENPNDAIGILRFADLHPDAKYLKDRAMSVIMENFEKLSLKLSDFSGGNDNDLQGNRLREEYVLYTMRRIWMWNLT